MLLKLYQNKSHDDIIKWKHFPHYWPFVWGIHRSPVNSPHKGQRRGALMFSLICVWINDWVNNREAGDLRRYHTHYDIIVMWWAGCSDGVELYWNEWNSDGKTLNSSPPSAEYMRQWIVSALVQIVACRLFGTMPLSKSMLGYCQLDP